MVFNRTLHASFFISFSCGGISGRCIPVYATLGKRPVTVAGAHQKELGFATTQTVTNSSHVKALGTHRRGQRSSDSRRARRRRQSTLLSRQKLCQDSHPSVCRTNVVETVNSVLIALPESNGLADIAGSLREFRSVLK